MKGFLFDLNGTMVDDMAFHITAWHEVFNTWGVPVSMEHMKEECYGKNEEIVHRLAPGKFTAEQVQQMSMQKEMQYRLSYQPHLQLLPGLDTFLGQAQSKMISMAIGSASIRSNIDFVIDNLQLGSFFHAIVGAEDVENSKPHPETFLRCAEWLHLPANQCVVFEDSTKGVAAALSAGMYCVAITTLHNENEFAEFSNVLLTIKDYTDPRLNQLVFADADHFMSR